MPPWSQPGRAAVYNQAIVRGAAVLVGQWTAVCVPDSGRRGGVCAVCCRRCLCSRPAPRHAGAGIVAAGIVKCARVLVLARASGAVVGSVTAERVCTVVVHEPRRLCRRQCAAGSSLHVLPPPDCDNDGCVLLQDDGVVVGCDDGLEPGSGEKLLSMLTVRGHGGRTLLRCFSSHCPAVRMESGLHPGAGYQGGLEHVTVAALMSRQLERCALLRTTVAVCASCRSAGTRRTWC